MSTRSRLLTRLAHRLDGARILGGVCALGLLATSSCTGGGTSDTAPTATASDGNRGTRVADFVNGGFESSSTSFAPWTVTTMLNTNGITNFPPVVYADLGLLTGGNAPSSVVSPTTTGAPVPLGLVAADSLKYPFTGSNALLLNAEGETKNASVIEQSLTVAATDVDPADGVVHVRFAAAGVVEASTHTGTQQPYIFLELVNTTTGASLFHTFNYSNMPGVTWNTSASPTATVYTNWKAFDIAPGSGGIRLGDTLHARIVASGCQPGGHWGEIYLDQFGTTFPVPDVVVSAPAYATAGSALTYTVTAKNGGNGPATGTVVHFTLPTEADSTVAAPKSLPTTFASYSAPNATCVVGTGTPVVVTCTIGALSPGASNTFTVTVNLPTALQETTAGFSGTVNVNEGTYDVVTAQNTTPLSGGVVQTQIAALLTTPVDLSTSLTDGVPSLLWGSNDTYTYTVQNKSAASITGSTVTDTAPTTFAVSSWSCAASTGSTCGTASGTTGAINATTGTIAANGTLTYTVKGKWTGTGTSNQTYTMTATPPAGYVQSVTFDNIGSDTDELTSTQVAVTVAKTGNGTGTIVSSPAGISCGTGCTTQTVSYASGDTIALYATAATGNTFTGWSGGGCTGTVNPCLVTPAAATTVSAEFDAPSLAAVVSATSNGGSITQVRPGDTEDSTVTVTVPNGQNAGVIVSDTLPAGLTYVSAGPVVTTGTVTCSGGGGTCATPTIATAGSTTTFDFGVVTCATVGGCTLAETVHAQSGTGASDTNGTALTSTFAASAAASATTAVTVVEPNLALAENASPASGITRGQVTTVTATLTNTGVATSGAYDAVATFATPANTTPQNYQQGTCPAATAVLNTTSSTFTFPTGATSSFPVGSTCTFSYDLLLGASAPLDATISIPGAVLTSKSTPTAPSKSYSQTASPTSILTSLLGAGATCSGAGDCTDGVCDGGKCGYATGDGPCTPTSDPRCRSGMCSTSRVCEPAGGCLVDGDCTAAQFCNTVTDSCEAKLLNGTPIPTIAGHVPVLDMACNAAVGTAVCLTGVCDGTTSGVCGLGLGEGTCTSDAECRAGTCVLTAGSANLGKCEPCVGDADCASSATNKACDTTTNQCVSCTGTNAAACTGSTAFCDTTTDTCTGCTGDNGSAATYACPAGTPYCNPDPVNGGACTSTCYADSDCGSASWCDAGACTPKLPNGSPIPSAPSHTPTLDGTCTGSAATAVCVSGGCDGTANTCGYANGEGPCTVDAQCTNGVCPTTGTNAGLCEACRDDGTCGGATPVCNTVTNTCAACGPTSSAQCAGVTPVCNTTGFVCVGCTADYGTSDGYSCPQSAPNCNLETGSCGTSCTTDNQCGTGRWCDANLCVAKLANGTPIPSDPSHVPTIVQVCTVQIANLICLSDTCDPTLNICGIGIGDGTCTSDDQCVSGGACSGGRCIASTVVTGDGGVVVVANPDGGTTTTIPVTAGNDDPTDHFNVLGGGCSLDPSGGANGGAELGALVTLVGLVNARRRRDRRNAAAVATKATKGAV